MTNNTSKSKLEKITKESLKTLGWTTLPGVMSIIGYSKKYYDKEICPIPEITVFLVTSAITMGTTFGINVAYDALAKKEYSTQSITIEVKPHTIIGSSVLDFASYASPLIRLAKVGLANDVTSIKTSYLEVEIENSELITFDKTRGFTLNKDSYYNNNFRIKNVADTWIEYNPSEIITINNKYEKLKQKSEKITEEALNNGNIGKIATLDNNMTQLQNSYESKRIELKKAQMMLDTELTDLVSQLNTQYLNYKKIHTKTAIPGRDYNLSDIKK